MLPAPSPRADGAAGQSKGSAPTTRHPTPRLSASPSLRVDGMPRHAGTTPHHHATCPLPPRGRGCRSVKGFSTNDTAPLPPPPRLPLHRSRRQAVQGGWDPATVYPTTCRPHALHCGPLLGQRYPRRDELWQFSYIPERGILSPLQTLRCQHHCRPYNRHRQCRSRRRDRLRRHGPLLNILRQLPLW
jgi:hypothetical protein